ncbi:MAG: hypothetical protein FK734_02840 [Asgard group archaeon]|nr:hypothetical protein [Asgard group archaeon]
MNNKIAISLTVCLIFSCISTNFLIQTVEGEQSNFNNDIKLCENLITSFDDFDLLRNDGKIISTKTSTGLTFDFTGSVGSSRIREYYYLTLNGYGKVANFELELTMEYSYTGTEFGGFIVSLGSYYEEAGSLFPSASVPDNYGYLCFAGAVYLPYMTPDGGGTYSVGAYKFDWEEKAKHDSFGSLKTTNTIKLIIKRTSERSIKTIVEEDGRALIQKWWRRGLSRPLSVVRIGTYLEEGYTGTIEVSFSSLSLNIISINPDWEGTTEGFLDSDGALLLLIFAICFLIIGLSITGLVFLIRYVRKRDEDIKIHQITARHPINQSQTFVARSATTSQHSMPIGTHDEKRRILLKAIEEAGRNQYKIVAVKTDTLLDFQFVTGFLLKDKNDEPIMTGFYMSIALSTYVLEKSGKSMIAFPQTLTSPPTLEEAKQVLLDNIFLIVKENNFKFKNQADIIEFESVLTGQILDSNSEQVFLRAFLELSKEITFVIVDPRTSYGRMMPMQIAMRSMGRPGMSPYNLASYNLKGLIDQILAVAVKVDLGQMINR